VRAAALASGEIAVVVAQDQDHRTTSEFDPPSGLAMAPSAVCSRQCALVFSLNDDRRDIARLRGGEQRAGDHRIGLGHAAIELFAKTVAQPLRGASDDPGDVVLWDTETGQVPTFSRSASLTTKAVLAMDGCRWILVHRA
jgi:hypothetical protein